MDISFPAVLPSLGVLVLIFWTFKLLFLRSPRHFDSLSGKHVAITGASSGIGLSLAKKCVLEGAFVTLMARTEKNLVAAVDTLVTTCGGRESRILVKVVDVRDADAISMAITESFRWRPIDILICNAGLARSGLVDDVSVKDIDLVISTNFLGCVYTIHAALPLMKGRSTESPSSIVIMGSLSGLFFTPGMNVYTSTKYALKEFAEMLRVELIRCKIRVNFVCPGFTETPMLDEADRNAATSYVLSKLCLYNRANAQSPDEVAAKTMDGVKKGDFLITTFFGGFLIGVLSRGMIPAESIARALIELFLLVPIRVISIAWLAYAQKALKRSVKDNLQEQKHQERNYIFLALMILLMMMTTASMYDRVQIPYWNAWLQFSSS